MHNHYISLFRLFLILTCVMESEAVTDLDDNMEIVINNIKLVSEDRLNFSSLYHSFSPIPDLKFDERTTKKQKQSDENMGQLEESFDLRYTFLIIVVLFSFLIEIVVILQLCLPGKCGTCLITSIFILSSVFLCMFGVNLAFSTGANDVCEGLKKNQTQNVNYFLTSFTKTSLYAGDNNINNEIYYDFYYLTEITKPDEYTKENYTECRSNISKYCDNDDNECIENIEILLTNITTCYDILDQIQYYLERKDFENLIPEDAVCQRILPEFNFLAASDLALAICYIISAFILLYYFKIFDPNLHVFVRKKSIRKFENNLKKEEDGDILLNDASEVDDDLNRNQNLNSTSSDFSLPSHNPNSSQSENF
ncbi:protein tweety [Anaeramoeba flamelloides]|uniref:Protein tweety n=1 Tax=Anaeramoeba flamelloides TaxID=1746091 RepID=A0ABQ8YIA5_9EUKA|nr:protein tweety [Anaeramoeba flamelloides]